MSRNEPANDRHSRGERRMSFDSKDGKPISRYASILRPGLFADEVHWVTGGGSGIGRCVAHELASLGATVILTGRGEEKLQKVAAEITEDGGHAEAVACDIRDEDAVRTAVADVVARHGRFHPRSWPSARRVSTPSLPPTSAAAS
jgi:3-oxoacyl-ACP reductase-like protein